MKLFRYRSEKDGPAKYVAAFDLWHAVNMLDKGGVEATYVEFVDDVALCHHNRALDKKEKTK